MLALLFLLALSLTCGLWAGMLIGEGAKKMWREPFSAFFHAVLAGILLAYPVGLLTGF